MTRLRDTRPLPSRLQRPGAVTRVVRESFTPDPFNWVLDRRLDPTLGFECGGLGFPGGAGYAGIPADRTQDKSHSPIPYMTELEYFRHIVLARDLIATNDLAIGFGARVRQYVGRTHVAFVLSGQSPGA